MRIGVLARQIKVKPSAIIAFLNEIGVETDKGVNTKLMKAGVDRVVEHFNKELFDIAVEETPTEIVEESLADSMEITEETFKNGKSQFAEEVLEFSESGNKKEISINI